MIYYKQMSLPINKSWVDWVKKVSMLSDCGVLGQGGDHLQAVL
jgi:hypothetical protein